MTVTARTNGILYNDGTLQTTASQSVPDASTTKPGIGYSSLAFPAFEGPPCVPSLSTIARTNFFGPGAPHQHWSVVTSQRTTNVTYHNTDRYGIVVAVTTNKNGGWVELHIYVNGIDACQSGGDQQHGWGAGNVNGIAIVPPGASYSVTSTTGISHWAELA